MIALESEHERRLAGEVGGPQLAEGFAGPGMRMARVAIGVDNLGFCSPGTKPAGWEGPGSGGCSPAAGANIVHATRRMAGLPGGESVRLCHALAPPNLREAVLARLGTIYPRPWVSGMAAGLCAFGRSPACRASGVVGCLWGCASRGFWIALFSWGRGFHVRSAPRPPSAAQPAV